MALTQRERSVCDLVARRAGAMLSDLRAWVAIPSATGQTAAIDEQRGVLVRRLESLGAVSERITGMPAPAWLRERGSGGPVPPVVVCRRGGRGDGRSAARRVLLCGHVDTVHDPHGAFRTLSVSSDGQRGTGPGCVDMKGGLLVALAALEALEEAGAGVEWSFIIVSDEETGSFHSDAALRAEAARGYACGLVFEPALPDGSLVIERAGSGQFMIECEGRAAHVGRDFVHGISAVHALAVAIDRAMEMADVSRGLIVNVGPLEGGQATNVVPDRARAWGNVRCMTACSEPVLLEGLRKLETNHDRLPRTRVQLVMNRPSKPLTPGVEALAMMARAVAQDLGQPLPFGKTGGVCDGNNLQAGGPAPDGLPVIDTLGPRGGELHTTKEWIDIPSLVERAQLAAVLMLRVTERGVEGPRA